MTVTRYIGTCPVCFHRQRLRLMNTRTWPREMLSEKLHLQADAKWGMVHHGYRRPGHGEIEGDCYGVGWPPWELSPNGNVAYVARVLRPQLEHSQDFLQRLQSGEVREIRIERRRGAWGTPEFVTLTPADGDKFERELRSRIVNTENRIRWLTQDIAERDAQIRDWQEQPLITEEEEIRRRETAPERVQRQQERDAKRAERLAKRAALDATEQRRAQEKLDLMSEYRQIFNDLAFRAQEPGVRKEARDHWQKMQRRQGKKAYLNFWAKHLEIDEALEILGLAKRSQKRPDYVAYADQYGLEPRIYE